MADRIKQAMQRRRTTDRLSGVTVLKKHFISAAPCRWRRSMATFSNPLSTASPPTASTAPHSSGWWTEPASANVRTTLTRFHNNTRDSVSSIKNEVTYVYQLLMENAFLVWMWAHTCSCSKETCWNLQLCLTFYKDLQICSIHKTSNVPLTHLSTSTLTQVCSFHPHVTLSVILTKLTHFPCTPECSGKFN